MMAEEFVAIDSIAAERMGDWEEVVRSYVEKGKTVMVNMEIAMVAQMM